VPPGAARDGDGDRFAAAKALGRLSQDERAERIVRPWCEKPGGREQVLAMRAGKATHRPYIPTVAVDNTRKGFEPADFEAVERHLTAPLRPLMRFLYLTGWRAGEALGLTWAGVDFAAGVVRLEPGVTKNREGRELPFAAFPAPADLLRARREQTSAAEREQQRIIATAFHRNGKPIRSYAGAWEAACTEAGLSGRLVHDLRRTAVRNLERAGVSRSVAMKLTGHRTEAVYRRHAITSGADLSRGRGEARNVARREARGADGAPIRRVAVTRDCGQCVRASTGTIRGQSSI
jgi:integrase